MTTLIAIALLGTIVGGFDCYIRRKREQQDYQQYLNNRALFDDQVAAEAVARKNEVNSDD